MTISDNSFQINGVKERFAHLHYRAACVRLEMLSRILEIIDQNGGIEQAPKSVVSEAVAAAADVAENLRWSYERITDTGHRRAADNNAENRLDFPATSPLRSTEAPRSFPGARAGGSSMERPASGE